MRRRKFTIEEDELIKELKNNTPLDWDNIASIVNIKCGFDRTKGVCETRWHNYLKKDFDNSKITKDEETKLIHAIQHNGKSWKNINQEFPNRSVAWFKNSLASIIRKIEKDA